MRSENFHPSACRVPRTFSHARTYSENIVQINTTRRDWAQDVPDKIWEKFSENMFFPPFRLLPRVNHWLQRHSLSRSCTVTGGTIIYDVTYCPPLDFASAPQSVTVQTALRLGFSQTTIGRCFVDPYITRRKYDKLLIKD